MTLKRAVHLALFYLVVHVVGWMLVGIIADIVTAIIYDEMGLFETIGFYGVFLNVIGFSSALPSALLVLGLCVLRRRLRRRTFVALVCSTLISVPVVVAVVWEFYWPAFVPQVLIQVVAAWLILRREVVLQLRGQQQA